MVVNGKRLVFNRETRWVFLYSYWKHMTLVKHQIDEFSRNVYGMLCIKLNPSASTESILNCRSSSLCGTQLHCFKRKKNQKLAACNLKKSYKCQYILYLFFKNRNELIVSQWYYYQFCKQALTEHKKKRNNFKWTQTNPV